MQDWLKAAAGTFTAAFVTVTTAAVKRLYKRQKLTATRQVAMEEGLKALLHDRIYKSYADCILKGYASVDDIRNLEYLYRPYHALGGNGTGTELYERIKKMPVGPAKQQEVN